MERTLIIIKPDAVRMRVVGKIIGRFELAMFSIIRMKLIRLTKEEAKSFYAIHKEKSFFNSLIDYVTSSEVVPVVLEREDAVMKARSIIGATDPKKAKVGTIRGDFASSIEENAIHGSDSIKNAQKEIAFFFPI